MKFFFIFIAIIFFIVLQTSGLAIIFDYPNTPDLLLLGIISCTLLFGFSKIFIWSIISGIIFDLISFEKIGFSAILFVLSAYLVSFFTKRFSIENKTGGFFTMVLIISIITFFYRYFIVIFNYFSPDIFFPFKNVEFFRNVWVEMILNLIFFIPMFFLIKKIKASYTSSIYNVIKTN